MRPVNSFGTAFRGTRNNFDALRLAAALAVLFGHSFVLTAGVQTVETIDPLSRFLTRYAAFGEATQEFAVDLFFVISGFLVTCSYLRSRSLLKYAVSRALRIYPAAVLSALVTVLALSLLSPVAPAAYFSAPETGAYLLHNSFLYKVKYGLPGVFESNPYGVAVNGSLWTLPLELRCYIGLAVLGAVGLLNDKRFFNAALMAVALSVIVPGWSGWISGNVDKLRLILFFMAGVGFYINRDHIPFGIGAFAVIAVGFVLAPKGSGVEKLVYVALVTYATLGLALTRRLPLIDLKPMGDLSYGVYLYAFPVQQALIHGFPNLFGAWPLVAAATVVSCLLAAASWWLVERNALGFKKRLLERLS